MLKNCFKLKIIIQNKIQIIWQMFFFQKQAAFILVPERCFTFYKTTCKMICEKHPTLRCIGLQHRLECKYNLKNRNVIITGAFYKSTHTFINIVSAADIIVFLFIIIMYLFIITPHVHGWTFLLFNVLKSFFISYISYFCIFIIITQLASSWNFYSFNDVMSVPDILIFFLFIT